eukprot:1761198-Amphidinium_carterae.1
MECMDESITDTNLKQTLPNESLLLRDTWPSFQDCDANRYTIYGTCYGRIVCGGLRMCRLPTQVRWEAFPLVFRKGTRSYYHEHYTETKFVKAYEQRKTVADKPNPPGGR